MKAVGAFLSGFHICKLAGVSAKGEPLLAVSAHAPPSAKASTDPYSPVLRLRCSLPPAVSHARTSGEWPPANNSLPSAEKASEVAPRSGPAKASTKSPLGSLERRTVPH